MARAAVWIEALEAARRGDPAPARATRATQTAGSNVATAAVAADGALDDYFFGRCLAEAGADLDDAVASLRRACEAESANTLIAQALALALARRGDRASAHEAVLIWHRRGLPHDLDLLGATALAIERPLRPLPETEPTPDDGEPSPEWPADLAEPPPGRPTAAAPDAPSPPPEGCDNLSHPVVPETTLSGRMPARKVPSRALSELERLLMDHACWKVLRLAGVMLAQGRESAELHLMAGMAAEELGLAGRARAYLGRAGEIDPKMLMARTILGRVYWRMGWFDLALALWRSLPVEGPYDHGRHYHLALGHDALGRPAEASEAMGLSLRDFCYDTRHFYIERAYRRWADQAMGEG